jgi:Fe-S cluster assembly ATPase SufC
MRIVVNDVMAAPARNNFILFLTHAGELQLDPQEFERACLKSNGRVVQQGELAMHN